MKTGAHLEAMKQAEQVSSALMSSGYEADTASSWKEARQRLLQDPKRDKTAGYVK